MLSGEHAAPGLTEEMIGVANSELVEKILELIEEKTDGPEVGAAVAQMRRVTVAELIVMNDRATGAREVCHRQQVVVRSAWSSVRHDERRTRRIEVTGNAVPGLPFTEVQPAARGGSENRLRR